MSEDDSADSTDLSDSQPTGREAARKIFDALGARCAAAGLHWYPPRGHFPGIYVRFLNGANFRELELLVEEQAEALLAFPFEHVVFLGELMALWIPPLGRIEAALFKVSATRFSSTYDPTDRAFSLGYFCGPADVDTVTGRYEARVTIGRASDEFDALCSAEYMFRTDTIRIEGVQCVCHDEAYSVLTTLSNAVLFALEREYQTAYYVPRLPRTKRNPTPLLGEARPMLPAPLVEASPMSLYWYARAAADMPLIAFLGYYQVLEYYMPIRTPTLRSERERLCDLLQRCVDAPTLSAFLHSSVERRQFFEGQGGALAARPIPLGQSPEDPRSPVAERVYEIRCRIVHTKRSESSFILPASPQAALLEHDIALVQLLAQAVLLANAREIAEGR